ncbi:MAG: DNA-binding response regulator [Psychrosphaera sp.]|nr:DNA-binding response regulator [Psychrosphaera sp.]
MNEELIEHEISSIGISKVTMASLQQTDNDTNQLSLLIIEDNPDMQQYVVSIMSKTYHCYCADNGQMGIDKALEVVPDLIICDVMMPVMDGFEATKQLKENELTAHIPVILLTARGDKDSRLTGWKSLADDYIAKPFDEEELLLRATNLIAIRTILRQRFTSKVLQGEPLSSNDENALNEKDSQFIEKVTDIINTHLHDELYSVEQLSEQVFMSERQLQRKLKALIDFTPREFVQHLRLLKAEALLAKGERVADVSDATGFSSSSYFARCFKAKYNMTPKQFSQGR